MHALGDDNETSAKDDKGLDNVEAAHDKCDGDHGQGGCKGLESVDTGRAFGTLVERDDEGVVLSVRGA